MAINFNDNLRILKGQPIDSRYFASNGLPYTSTSSVFTQIPITYRYLGLTVNVNKVEYWFKDDLLTLTLKVDGSSGDTTSIINPSITLAGTNYGSYNDGDTISGGTTIQEVFENMFRVVIPPYYQVPTTVLTPDDLTVEIGTYVDYTLASIFTQNDAGSLNNYLLRKTYSGFTETLYNGLPIPTTGVTDFTTDYVLAGNLLSYSATTTYDEGAVKNDNLGNPNTTGQILSGSTVDTFTVTGVRAYFKGATTATIAPTGSTDVRALTSALNPVNGSTFTINIPAGTTRVVFAYPDSLQAVTSVKYVELGNGEVKDTFTLTTFNVEGANNEAGIDYKVYTYLPAVAYGDTATYNVTI